MVTAKDINGGGMVEILNPDQYLAEITGKTANLDIEMTIGRGIGFVPRDVLHGDKMPVGTIAVDAIYTPIRKVGYEVENMRVGDRTDYNRLRISIQTDGTIGAREALEESIKIMLAQMRSILNLKEEEEAMATHGMVSAGVDMSSDAPASAKKTLSAVSDDMAEVLKTRVENLELSTRTANALSEANIRTIGGLTKKTEQDILELPGLGQKAVDEIKDALGTLGVSLKA
jgi:DNA-directed RNA polymerase subunit alpha